jgi:hypothetical protein
VSWGTSKDAQLRRLSEAMLGRGLTRAERDELQLLCSEMLDAQCEQRPIDLPPQRRHVRARVALDCALTSANGDLARGSTCDMGLGGLSVWVDRPLRKGESVRVRLRAQDRSEFEFDVRTMWMIPEAGGWRLGLRYQQVERPMRAVLTSLVLETASDELLEEERTPPGHA